MSSASQLSYFTQSEIAALLKSARRVLKHPGLDFLIAPARKDTGRILVITPKRIGNAPQRNKVRRRIKALFYEEKILNRGYDCIAIVKLAGINLPYEELKKLILESLDAHAQ